MKKLRSMLTYANVISTLCLFLLLGGGAAVAASHLGTNSVGAKQLKKNSVTTAKIKNKAVTGTKIRNNSVNGAKVADGSLTGADVQDRSLTGADIDQASLTGVRAANVTGISIKGNAKCTPSGPLPSGVTSARLAKGICYITFPNAVTNCSATVSIHFDDSEGILLQQARTAEVADTVKEPNVLYVITYEIGTAINRSFDLVLVC